MIITPRFFPNRLEVIFNVIGKSGVKVESTTIKNGLLILANFNQEVEIGNVLNRVENCFKKDDVIVVDDGSTDNSGNFAAQKGFKVIWHLTNLGLGAAIRTGINYALSQKKYDYVVISSSNGKIQPEEIRTIIEPILKGECDYSQGTRFLVPGYAPALPLFRRISIPIFTLFASLVLKKRFTDITCGFRAYKLDFLRDPKINLNQDWLNRYELEYYIHYWACRLGVRIKEVPVNIVYSHLKEGRKTKIIPFIGWWSMMRPFFFLPLGVKK